MAVNHLEAHALTARLTDGTPFPYCLFLASGGHTQIVAVLGVGDYERLGTTVDDAIGEAFDKVAKMLGLGLSRRPGGRARRARAATPRGSHFRGRMLGRAARRLLAVGTEDRRAARGREDRAAERQDVRDLCAAFQAAVVDVAPTGCAPALGCSASGAAADRAGRRPAASPPTRRSARPCRRCVRGRTALLLPATGLCTDNGAMIAWAGAERLAAGLTDSLETAARARWPLAAANTAADDAPSALLLDLPDATRRAAEPISGPR